MVTGFILSIVLCSQQKYFQREDGGLEFALY